MNNALDHALDGETVNPCVVSDIVLSVLNAVSVMRSLTELLEHDVLEPLVRHELHPAVQDGEDVVTVLGAAVARLQEHLHLPQVLALLQQRDRVVLTPARR